MKKQILPKGFLSSGGKPTMNSIVMFMIYMSNLPIGVPYLTKNKLDMNSVNKVREYFGFNYGFDTMMFWGFEERVSKSKTSKGRYESMRVARILAENNLNNGVVIPCRV